MRKKPNLTARMERCSRLLVRDPAAMRGRWKELYPGGREIRLEIGCGKGRFSAETARQNPDILYLALERVPDAMIIAMERCQAGNLSNIFFIDGDAALLRDYFAPNEVDLIYMNFCDPWPGVKHARRRLTHEQFLILYRGILREGGQIHFKSDNHNLFEWSLFQFPKAGYELSEMTRNLHGAGVQGVMTDYEEKFYQLGTPINRCVATKLLMDPEPEYKPIAGPVRRSADRKTETRRARTMIDSHVDACKRALELREETVAHRRYFHTNAEVGLETPKAVAYLMEHLKAYGLTPETCGHGVTASLGTGGKTLLLRADMDALPMGEESGEPFACPTGTEAHTCGHDFHAAMLLTAAKMLKEDEKALKGTVRFMFQPAEETFEGARDMIDHGILEGVDAALAFHVTAGKLPMGLFMYNSGGVMMSSVDGFRITVKGKGAHGAYPNSAVDPINIAVHIYLALEALIAREADPSKNCVLTVGNFAAGSAPNIIPDTAVLQGTIRTNDKSCRALLVRRMKEMAEGTARIYGGGVEIEMLSQVPPLICDQALTDRMAGYLQALPGLTPCPGITASASEDFAVVAERVPSTFMYLSAGYQDGRGEAPAHNPKVRFNEDVCAIGPACLVHCAKQWLAQAE